MNIYIIAGPPGIGKSSNAYRYIPFQIPIIDHDLAGYQYKKEGFADYKQLGILSGNAQIKDNLFANKDFALELNLGFQSHYDYLKSIAYFNPENKTHLILFFTDSIELCMLRAKIRHENGGHLVEKAVIEEMYENTSPLFEKHKNIFSSIQLLDVKNDTIFRVNKNFKPKWAEKYSFLFQNN